MTSDINILVVEDDEDINRLLCQMIDQANYRSQGAYSGTEAMLYVDQKEWDVILLDLMLPGKSGEDLIPFIRDKFDVPIIVISAKEGHLTKVNMLRSGADDYITKPFHPDEVIARIEAQLRRYRRTERKNQLTFKDIVIDLDTKQVMVNQKPVPLTAREYKILKLFLSSPKKMYTKENIFESIWGVDYYGDDNTVNVHMSHLRSKLAKANPKETYFETIWGMGYRLKG